MVESSVLVLNSLYQAVQITGVPRAFRLSNGAQVLRSGSTLGERSGCQRGQSIGVWRRPLSMAAVILAAPSALVWRRS